MSSSEPGTSLPWERGWSSQSSVNPHDTVYCGQFVLQTLLTEFSVQVERKINSVLKDSVNKELARTLLASDKEEFDQLLRCLANVAENALPSILTALFQWHSLQITPIQEARKSNKELSSGVEPRDNYRRSLPDEAEKLEKHELAIEFIFCLALIAVLPQLSVHPVSDEQVRDIEGLCFKNFKRRDFSQHNSRNGKDLTDLYAEVLGVLSEARFQSVIRKFKHEIHQSYYTPQTVINIINGMRFLKLKLYPIEALQASFEFMLELGDYFLEAKEKETRHSYAGLIVGLLVPVAAVINREVNVPVSRNFVEKMYQPSLQLSSRKTHAAHLYDMITILLSVSQKQFFLTNWPIFLQMCISGLRTRDLSKVSFNCIYRLVWVYVVRIKCEANNSTNQRLSQIIESIFPKGSRNIIPRDGIQPRDFIQLIQIIALEKLDYVMREVLYDLLCVNNRKMITSIYPERMNIGLNAFLAIANHLERKEGPPAMPGSNFSYPSEAYKKRTVQWSKNSITDEIAESIGVGVYLIGVRKALEGMLHNLQIALGHILQTNPTYANKNNDEILQGERKQKVQLLKTCIGAIPRIIPEGMQKANLIDLIARLSIHMDTELCSTAVETLKDMIRELPRWRLYVVGGYLTFMQSIPHNYPDVMDRALRRLSNFITIWRDRLQQDVYSEKSQVTKELFQTDEKFYENIGLLHKVEGMSIVMLCSCSPRTKALAYHLLEEARQLFDIMVKHFRQRGTYFEDPVMVKIEEMSGGIVRKCLQVQHQTKIPKAHDMRTLQQFLAEECKHQDITCSEEGTRAPLPMWLVILFGMLHELVIKKKCASALYQAFLIGSARFHKIHALVEASISDPGIGRSRRSIDKNDMCLWRNLMILCCKTVRCPSKFNKNMDIQLAPLPQFASMKDPPVSLTASDLYKRIIILLKNDSVDVQEIAVTALGASNPDVFSILVNCMDTHIGEILGGRTETVRRRRRRENLRLQVSRVYELCADNGCFKKDSIGDMGETIDYITQYIDHTKSICEEDKDSSILTDLKFHFCEFIRKMIVSSDSVELNFESLAPVRRMELFRLFRGWCHYDAESLSDKIDKSKLLNVNMSKLNSASLLAMCALLNAGPISENDLRHNNSEILIWLKHLIGSDDKYTHSLGCQVTEMLLLNNPEKRSILNWVMNQCYIGTGNIPSGCFLALVRVLANCQYPCQLIPTVVVTLHMSAYNDTGVREKATYLLQLIVNRFFKEWRDDNQHKLLKTDSHVMLSRQLSQQHKEISLPVFNEVMLRLQQCGTCTQKTLLQILAPWLANVELIEYQLLSSAPKQLNKKQCIGSVHGSLLVFTNLMWITIEKNLEHEAELQELWGELMKHPNNPRVLLNYIIILASLGAVPHTILPQIKKVVMFMCRYKPPEMINMLAEEVDRENIKAVSQLLEREECPPYFYHIHMLQKHEKEGQVHGEEESKEEEPHRPLSPPEKDAISLPYFRDSHVLSRSSGDLNSQEEIHKVFQPKKLRNRWSVLLDEAESKHYRENIPPYLILAEEEDGTRWARDWVKRSSKKHFNPLPLPCGGGNLGPLMTLFPACGPEVQILRCNFAIILLCDIVLDQSSYCWTQHLPLLLHITFLGFDHSLWLVHEHCKKLMLNLIHAFIEQSNPQLTRHKLLDAVNFPIAVDSSLLKDLTVHSEISINSANAVIDCRVNLDHYTAKFARKAKKQLPQTIYYNSKYTRQPRYASTDGLFEQHLHEYYAPFGSPGTSSIAPGSSQEHMDQSDDEDDDSGSSHMSYEMSSSHPSEMHDEVPMGESRGSTPTEFASIVRKAEIEPEVLADRVRSVLKFMNARDQRPLWNYEQITPLNLTIESFGLLKSFLTHVLSVFDALVDCDLKKNMCIETLNWAVSCGQRHYAGRSFEIFRCLQEELSRDLLLEVLRRLMENICDPDEAPKGYVVECLLTLERNTHLICERIHSELLPKYKSKTDTIKRRPLDTRRHSSWDVLPAGTKVTSKQHLIASSTASDDTRVRTYSEQNNLRVKAYSLTSFRDSFPTLIECIPQDFSLKELLNDDDVFIISRIFWCCICISESDYEHEFGFAIRLLTSLLNCICVTDNYTANLLEKVLEEINWPEFPGIIHLFLKGLPTQDLCESTLELLSKLLPFSNRKIFSGVDDTALPLAVLSLLPRLINTYNSPDDLSRKVAEDVVILCGERKGLADLGKIMSMYIDSSYPKNCEMWIGAVCKYVNDAYIDHCSYFLTFLVNMLQNGPYVYHHSILKIVYQSIKHIYLNHNFIPIHSPKILQVLAKHEFSTAHEDQHILKLIISHSSSISLPVDTVNLDNYRASLGAFSLFEHGLPELPGRSIQFKVDFKSDQGESISSSLQSLVSSTHNLVPSTNWKKPSGCFRKCRDRLASLLKISGDIEQTNSLVFSAASDCEISRDIHHSTSSSDSVSVADLPNANVNNSISSIPDDSSLAGALHQFDFLNDENTADEGNDTDSINSSWRGGLNNSSYQSHSRDSSIDSFREKPRFKSLPHILHSNADYDESDYSSDSERSESRNNTLKRPRSSASPHPSRLSRSHKERIMEDDDLSSPDGPDTATPKLEDPDEELLFDISDSEENTGKDEHTAPQLYIQPPSPQKSLVTPTPERAIEYEWLDTVSRIVTTKTEDIDSGVILVFQRIVKSHLLLFREIFQSSLLNFNQLLPEDTNQTLNKCLNTFNVTEVPFLYIDKILLNSPPVKNKFRFYILEAREKVEYLAKHQRTVASQIRQLGHEATDVSTKQNLRQMDKITAVCSDIQKLHFQFCALYGTFSRIVDLVVELRKGDVIDLSDSVSDLASRLFQAQMNPDIASLSSSVSDKSSRDPSELFCLEPLPEFQPAEVETAEQPAIVPELTDPIPTKQAGFGSLTKIMKRKTKKRGHRRGYSEAHIEMFKEVELEFEASNMAKMAVSQSQYDLYVSSTSLASTASPVSPVPSAPLHQADSVSNIHLSQVDVRIETLDGSRTKHPSDPLSEDDTASIVSEVPPPPTPGSTGSQEFDFPMPPPPTEAYYTSPQIARREKHMASSPREGGDIDNLQAGTDYSFYTDMGELRCLDQLRIGDIDKRSRKGSSCGGDDSSRSRNVSSSGSDLSGAGQKQSVSVPINYTDNSLASHSNTLSTTLVQFGSPQNNPYAGIMSYLTIQQTIVFINDHIEAVADSAATDTLHQARSRFGPYYFGSAENEDVITLIGIYCQLACQGAPDLGKIALWGGGGSDVDCSSLMTDTILLEGAISSFT